jgi:hypothetical protein
MARRALLCPLQLPLSSGPGAVQIVCHFLRSRRRRLPAFDDEIFNDLGLAVDWMLMVVCYFMRIAYFVVRGRVVVGRTRPGADLQGLRLHRSAFVKHCPTSAHMRRRVPTRRQTWAGVEQRLTHVDSRA